MIEERQPLRAHKISLSNRSLGVITGVKDVVSFDLNEIILDTDQGLLMIKGKNLHVKKLLVEKGEVEIMKETVTDPLLFFLASILFGVCLQAIYDIIRGIRRVFYHKSVFLFIEDIGFGIFTAVMAFIFLCTYNDGELRGFFFLGIVIGMILYYQLCSKFLLRAVIHITEKLKKIIRQFEKVCLRPGIHIKRNLKWQLKKEKKQVTMALKKQIKRGGKSDNTKETK